MNRLFSTVSFEGYGYPAADEEQNSRLQDEERSEQLRVEFIRLQQLAHKKVELGGYKGVGGVKERLQRLNEGLGHFNMQFGYRVFDEIVAFLLAAEQNRTFTDPADVFDAAILTKVLSKLRGSRAKLE